MFLPQGNVLVGADQILSTVQEIFRSMQRHATQGNMEPQPMGRPPLGGGGGHPHPQHPHIGDDDPLIATKGCGVGALLEEVLEDNLVGGNHHDDRYASIYSSYELDDGTRQQQQQQQQPKYPLLAKPPRQEGAYYAAPNQGFNPSQTYQPMFPPQMQGQNPMMPPGANPTPNFAYQPMPSAGGQDKNPLPSKLVPISTSIRGPDGTNSEAEQQMVEHARRIEEERKQDEAYMRQMYAP